MANTKTKPEQKPKQKRLKAEERRLTLIRAAVRLFTEKGYGETRMEEIASAAGCTTGPLYHFFKTKADVFEGVMDRYFTGVIHQVQESRGALDEPSPLKRMKASVDALLKIERIAAGQMFLREAPSILGPKRWSKTLDKLVTAGIEEDLREAMINGEIEPEPPKPLAELFTATIMMAYVRTDPKSEQSLEAFRTAILRMIDRLKTEG